MEHFVIGYMLIFLELQQTPLVCCTLDTSLSEGMKVWSILRKISVRDPFFSIRPLKKRTGNNDR